MSEQEKKLTLEELFEAQKKEFKAALSGDLQKNAIDFAEYMKNSSADNYLGECICFTVTNEVGDLHIFVHGPQSTICNSNYNNFPIDESIKELVWANVNPCRCAPPGCKERNFSFTILGKKFDNLCNCPIAFNNPDAETFGKIKEFVEASKICIDTVKQAEK